MGAEFEPESVLISLRQRQALRRRRCFTRSKLDRFRAEVVALHRAGATLAQLKLWLHDRRIDVSRTTIMRYLKRLPELLTPDEGGANG